MKPHLALDAPHAGLLVEIVDAPSDADLTRLEAWLRDEHLPPHPATSPAGLVLAFTPVPFTQGRIEQPGTPPVAPPEAVGRRLCRGSPRPRRACAIAACEQAAIQDAAARLAPES